MFPWDDYPRYQISPAIHSDLRHTDIVRHLAAFQAAHPNALEITPLGESVEGRGISMLTLGNGPKNILAWSQMHGNEPTHTAALLDLLNFLLEAPDHPSAKTILTGCQLHFILMLNPDGAERWTRRNAQDIDINRDALHQQTPEGRILRDAIKSLQPDFALNLHNQRPRTTVEQAQKVASFSLLTPPIDADDSDTENVVLAKQLAGHLAQTVAPYCPGPVSRYDADFMPRCFGEWVQQQGAATITIEAGGWTTVDAEPLVQLHFYGLVNCLEAIATGSFLEVAPEIYEALPRTGEHDLFDTLLRGVTIFNGAGQGGFRADLGINSSQIVDLGDLHVTTGKTLIDAADLLCLPGRIVWLPDATPQQLGHQDMLTSLLSQGVTTGIGCIDIAKPADLASLEKLRNNFSGPISLGFLAKLTTWSPEILDQLLHATSLGILGVLAEELPSEAGKYLAWLNIPILPESVLPTLEESAPTIAECAAHTQQCAQLLSLKNRGIICLDAIADFILLRADKDLDATTTLCNTDLQQVFVGGNVAFDQGKANNSPAGELLSS